MAKSRTVKKNKHNVYIRKHIMGNQPSRPSGGFRFRDPFPDRQGTIDQLNRNNSSLAGTLNGENASARTTQANIDNTIRQKNDYNNLTQGYIDDKPYKDADLSNKKGIVKILNSDIGTTQNNIKDTDTALRVTKSGLLATLQSSTDTTNKIKDTIDDTNIQTRNIYSGMNSVNHSLMNTINNNKNNHTTDISRINYQNQQTEYFSILNKLLLIFYLFLLFIFAFLFHKMQPNVSMFIKVIAILLLLLLPYSSLIYYQYIWYKK